MKIALLSIGYFLGVSIFILQGALLLFSPQRWANVQNAWYRFVHMPNRIDPRSYDGLSSRIAGAVMGGFGFLMLVGLFLKLTSN